MNYILDTDIMIYFLKGHENVVKTIAHKPPEKISTTIINQAELFFGAYNSTHKNKNLEIIENFLSHIQVIPFCVDSARIFAEQKAAMKKNGNLIADMDLMIASICLAKNRVLVTNNQKHFDRISHLKME